MMPSVNNQKKDLKSYRNLIKREPIKENLNFKPSGASVSQEHVNACKEVIERLYVYKTDFVLAAKGNDAVQGALQVMLNPIK
jgi:hypothetical protein